MHLGSNGNRYQVAPTHYPPPTHTTQKKTSTIDEKHKKTSIFPVRGFGCCVAQELKERQETPDPPEALSCIPSLRLAGESQQAVRGSA